MDVKSRRGDAAPRLDIQVLPAAASNDPALMERITDLTNEVYAVAEDGLWTDGATRTTVDEVAELTRAGQIAVARLRGRVVGCVRVQRLDERVRSRAASRRAHGRVRMLVADPAHRGVGIGRELVRFAERKCHAEGLRTMRLELLVPRAGPTRQRSSWPVVHTHRLPGRP